MSHSVDDGKPLNHSRSRFKWLGFNAFAWVRDVAIHRVAVTACDSLFVATPSRAAIMTTLAFAVAHGVLYLHHT